MNRTLHIFLVYLSSLRCLGTSLVDLPDSEDSDSNYREFIQSRNLLPDPLPTPEWEHVSAFVTPSSKHWLFRQRDDITHSLPYEDEKDGNIKSKISTLVQQTLHDAEGKIKSIQPLKEEYREQTPYKIGFILSLVKKSKEVLNELFNVAVRHRDSWKALEQLKIFELIVHTNVDTTNLVRQLVEIHVQYLNTTSSAKGKARVVLLKK